MDPDDLEPSKPKAVLKDLQPMSVAELEGYIRHLEAEIERARAAIAAKRNQRLGAESLFRK